jgi:catechol 2,3-dioxygenase-like lactoylglutathione lyase family enzyme
MSIKGLSCVFPSPDLKKTTGFYVTKLGFRAVEYLKCEQPHVCLYKDDIEIILLQANTDKVLPNRTLYGYGYDAYLYTVDQTILEKEFLEKDVVFVKRLHITDYQNIEFVIEDIDGRWLAFGLKIKD